MRRRTYRRDRVKGAQIVAVMLVPVLVFDLLGTRLFDLPSMRAWLASGAAVLAAALAHFLIEWASHRPATSPRRGAEGR